MVSDEIDHGWSESKNCVMDSWANGPAVLKKDAGSIHENARRESINKEIGRESLEKSAELLEALEAYGKDGQKLKAEIESETNIGLKFWPETSVINKRLENILNTKGFASSQKEPTSVNSQIRATGVLRSLTTALGKETTIREATSGCDEVINAFNNRFRTGYLGQWHGEKIKSTVYDGEPSYFN